MTNPSPSMTAGNAPPGPTPAIHGVHHSARPIWKLAETLHFYRDVMGLPLVHAITARGWGRADHPDFLHLFFDSGAGSAIAFFYYLGTNPPDYWQPEDTLLNRSVHTAWAANTREELLAWRARFESFGLEVLKVRHEVVESIYVTDPNGYMVEIAWQCRPFSPIDAIDARATVDAALLAEREAAERGTTVRAIEPVWQAKARLVRQTLEEGAAR